MIVPLKLQILTRGTRQYRMAVELGWDPTKLSRIIQQRVEPSPQEKKAIAQYLEVAESEIFSGHHVAV